MKEMISYCGYNCHLCFARSKYPILRRKMVDALIKYFSANHYTAKNVQCDGCMNNSRVPDKKWPVRICAKTIGLKNCVNCDVFPCDEVKKKMACHNGMLLGKFPSTMSLTEEEYNLIMKPLNSMPNLVNLLIESKKLPSWLKKY